MARCLSSRVALSSRSRWCSTSQGAATLGALAAVIRTVTRRNDGKKVQLKGDSLDITGYSPDDADKLIDKYYKKQEENEAEWKRMKEEGDS